MVNSNFEDIIGRVELTFEIAGVTRLLDVAIVNQLGVDYLLGADFYRIFNAMIHPREDSLTIEGHGDRIPLKIATLAVGETVNLAYVGLEDATDHQREDLRALLNRLIPPSDGSLPSTMYAEHKIVIESSWPVKQR